MITNTELYYIKMKEFQDSREELTEEHEKNVKSLKQSLARYKGSKGYEEDLAKENKRYETELQTLRDEYRPVLHTVFGGMMDAIGKRSIAAPTNEQVNLLNVLKMKRKVTLEECQRTAAAVKDNPIAVSIVSEIAQDHGIGCSFNDLCPEMTSQRAYEIVTNMKDSLEDFLMYDTTKASRLAKEYHDIRYGATDGQLVKRRLFTDQDDFYREEGFDPETLKQFQDIVDA
jgi:hypothetical protein